MNRFAYHQRTETGERMISLVPNGDDVVITTTDGQKIEMPFYQLFEGLVHLAVEFEHSEKLHIKRRARALLQAEKLTQA